MAYVKTQWVDFQEPYINAQNLNNIEQGIYDAQAQKQSITIASGTSGTFVDGMTYKYEFAWTGVTADHFGYVTDVSGYDVKNGLYVETGTDLVTLYFGANPANATMTLCVERVASADVE